MTAFPESRGWRPTAVVADDALIRSRMEVRAPHHPPVPEPESARGPFAVPALPWQARVQLAGKPLTPREIQLLGLIRDGATNYQAAFTMGCSEQTVKNHMSSILGKLEVPDRTAAVMAALRGRVIELGDGQVAAPISEQLLLAAEGQVRKILDLATRTLAEIEAIRATVRQPDEIVPRGPVATSRLPGICSVVGCPDEPAAYRGHGRPPLKCERHVNRRAVA